MQCTLMHNIDSAIPPINLSLECFTAATLPLKKTYFALLLTEGGGVVNLWLIKCLFERAGEMERERVRQRERVQRIHRERQRILTKKKNGYGSSRASTEPLRGNLLPQRGRAELKLLIAAASFCL